MKSFKKKSIAKVGWFAPRLSKDNHYEDLHLIETMEMLRLEETLKSSTFRNLMIEELNSQGQRDPVTKIRFLVSLDEYEKCDNKQEKRLKGCKIVATFFQQGSSLQLMGIPHFCEVELQNLEFEAFRLVKNIFLQELVYNPIIKSFL